MERYTDIEEFAKGGRISPERSATEPPKGTLGLGNNGNIWVNVPDKNGRLSWKQTPINDTFRTLFPFIKFKDNGNYVWFNIEDKNFIFRFQYGYEKDSIYTIEYKNSDDIIEKENTFQSLDNSFFQDFSEEEYNRLNSDGTLSYQVIKEGVMYLFALLKRLIDEKVLRSTTETPETPEKEVQRGKLYLTPERNVRLMTKDGISMPFLKTEDYEWIVPYTVDNEFVSFLNTVKTQLETKTSVGFIFDYENGFEFYIKSEKLNIDVQKIKTIEEAGLQYGIIVNHLENQKVSPIFINEYETIVSKVLQAVNNNEIEYNWRLGSQFKVGDKVYLPQTKRGKEIKRGSSGAYDEAIAKKQNFLYVTEINFPEITLNDKPSNDDGDYFREDLDNLALYKDTTPQPTPEIPKTDCEADPTKIVSSQVKSFYDLNKNRIEKLKPEFSCKIIQALVSLSDYESCGVASSESLPKPKNDLLSDIKNFKI